MTEAQLLKRTERLINFAKAHCDTARALRLYAGQVRGDILIRVRAQAHRRALRGLAHGGSDSLLPEPEYTETIEERCPYCLGADAIKPLGRVEASGGKVRAMYCCGTCDRAFVHVRRPQN